MNDLSDDYAGAGFGRPLEWGTAPVVLVIDMVRAYFEPDAELYMGSRDCLDSTVRVIAAARANGVPVIYTRVEYGPGGIDGGLFFRKVGALRHFVRGSGSTLGEIMPDIAPRDSDLVIAFASRTSMRRKPPDSVAFSSIAPMPSTSNSPVSRCAPSNANNGGSSFVSVFDRSIAMRNW